MFNVNKAAQVSLGTFGGLVTNTPAMNLPSGSSPDCADMAFKPAAVHTRPALQQVFVEDDEALPTYAGSYVDRKGIIRNLFLDAAGNLTVENLTDAPGVKSALGNVTPGSYAKSITAFGREYISPSDGIHGTDIPLQYDGTNLDRVTQDGPASTPDVENTVYDAVAMDPALAGGATMIRENNQVTVATASPHNLQVGYVAQISEMTAADVGSGIDSITINNEDLPGVATITTNAPHGLSPGVRVTVSGVTYVDVPGSIVHVLRQGQAVSITMSAAHLLSPGARIAVVGTVDNTFLGAYTVESVNDPFSFNYTQAEPTNVNAAEVGNVRLLWPTAATITFEVLETPTEDTFQVAINYSNGTWSNGVVQFAWNGNYFVETVPDDSTFTYKQNGPNATTTQVGMVTPNGQVAPGKHRVVVLFKTRQDSITAPSPPLEFVANGGQYLTVSNIPIGPENVVARILAFTGVEGAYFFYIPKPGQENGQVVSTATQIDDNTTTEVVLDFSDNSLFSALGISQPGNDLANQIVIDSALGFALIDGNRLLTYGQRNRVLSTLVLNMAFDGGALPSTPTLPTGWTAAGGGAGGVLTTSGRFGGAWSITGAGSIYQSGYLNAYGAPILQPNTQYTLRGWVKGTGETATITLSSADTGFTSTATLSPGSADGSWLEDDFTLKTPSAIPPDMIISLSGSTGAIIDELSLIFTEAPFIDKTFYASYVNNPEAFDSVSGVFGVPDTRKIMTAQVVRGSLYPLTQDPGGRLHVIQSNGVTEPAGWSTQEISANCGAISTFCATTTQANDGTAGGGEQWFAWISASGFRIFGGDQAWKISQEIQPDTDAINAGAWLTAWALNDPAARRIYFGIPKGVIAGTETIASAPNVIYHMDYKGLDSAAQIAAADPIGISSRGSLYTRDMSRKWCPWRIASNGAAMIYRVVGGPLYTLFYGGNGQYPGVDTETGCGNVFILCPNKETDDCLGQIRPYYVTYAFTSEEGEQAYQLGGQRHMMQYLQWNARGHGRLKVTLFVNTLSNPWPLNITVPLRDDPREDYEWGAGQASGQRIFIKFEGLPALVEEE